jgi:aryl-alcohol dehydrogenase-like predicted oxidoreductase
MNLQPHSDPEGRAVQGRPAELRTLGRTDLKVALAFVRQKPFTTSVLMAASNVAQLESNLESLDVTLSKELLKEIDSIHEDLPNPR